MRTDTVPGDGRLQRIAATPTRNPPAFFEQATARSFVSRMNCPKCQSDDVRRSRRRGPQEGLALRVKHQAPYRCRACGLRFVAEEEVTAESDRPLSIADYLGLRGWARRILTDQVIYGGIALLVILVVIIMVFVLAFGGIAPPVTGYQGE